MASTSPIHLKLDYRGKYAQYQKGAVYIAKEAKTKTNGFIGSEEKVTMLCKTALVFRPGACLAAPELELASKRTISLGYSATLNKTAPLRIYAPHLCLIVTENLFIGCVKFVVPPKLFGVMCKKITVLETAKETEFFRAVLENLLTDPEEIITLSNAASVKMVPQKGGKPLKK